MEKIPDEFEGSLANFVMTKPAMKGNLDTYKASLTSQSSRGAMSIMGSSKGIGHNKEADLYKNAMMKNAFKDNVSVDSYRSYDSKNS